MATHKKIKRMLCIHRVMEKGAKLFRLNFFKFPPNLIIFGKKWPLW